METAYKSLTSVKENSSVFIMVTLAYLKNLNVKVDKAAKVSRRHALCRQTTYGGGRIVFCFYRNWVTYLLNSGMVYM